MEILIWTAFFMNLDLVSSGQKDKIHLIWLGDMQGG